MKTLLFFIPNFLLLAAWLKIDLRFVAFLIVCFFFVFLTRDTHAVLSSDISRTDVAEVAVACLLKGKATDSCTFELNNIKGLYKAMGNLPDLPPELLHAGAPSYFDLLDGLQTDAEMLRSYYPKIVSTFAGGKDILSIDKIMIQQ